jgi:hypothetical protein
VKDNDIDSYYCGFYCRADNDCIARLELNARAQKNRFSLREGI